MKRRTLIVPPPPLHSVERTSPRREIDKKREKERGTTKDVRTDFGSKQQQQQQQQQKCRVETRHLESGQSSTRVPAHAMRIEEAENTVRLHGIPTPLDVVQEAIRILQQEAHAILECAERLKQCEESAQFKRAISILIRSLDRSGKIVVSGVGKSGRIGEKLAATFQSTGSCAVFMHPVEGLHGDLGMIQANDVMIAISHSGKTDELLQMMPSLKRRGTSVIAMCGDRHSPLVKESDAWVNCQVKSEADPHIPAPTSSTTVALAVGDAIAMALMRLRGFTPHHFALNHPGGALGRRLLLKVKDAMHRVVEVPMVAANANITEIMNKLNISTKCNALLVTSEDCNVSTTSSETAMGRDSSNTTKSANSGSISASRSCLSSLTLSLSLSPSTSTSTSSPSSSSSSSSPSIFPATACGSRSKVIGIITQDNIRRVLDVRSHEFIQLVATDVMTTGSVTCSSDDMLVDVKQLMEDRSISVLPVFKSTRLIGLVTMRDLTELI